MNLGRILIFISLVASLLTLILNIVPNKKEYIKCCKKIFWFVSISTITASLFLLLYYQFNCKFEYTYVAQHISTDLKPIYRISALWAGQGGSFLLWAVISMWMGFIVRQQNKTFNIYMIISIAILIFVCISNPFSISKNPPLEGNGLNQALQNPWMVIHPPLVFIGYSAMAILFSQSLFNNLEKKWVFVSWLFLGGGIFTGCIWAYNALGWGGYWAWDPIENAALIPWLILATMAHKKKIPAYLGMLPFVLAAFGTFLARSGILKDKSVHSYASSSMWIPLFLLLGSLFLILCIRMIRSKGNINKFISTAPFDKMLTRFCYITYIFAAIILIGTVLPIFSDFKIGMDFYNLTSLAFAILCSMLFLNYLYPIVKKKLSLILIFNTLIVIGIAIATGFSSIGWLCLLWIITIPLTPKIVFCKVLKNIWANISHIGLVLLMMGTLISSVFGEEGVFMEANLLNTKAMENNIIHSFIGDTIITEGTKYVTKPFIYLFWIGGTLMMIGILGSLCFPKKSRIS